MEQHFAHGSAVKVGTTLDQVEVATCTCMARNDADTGFEVSLCTGESANGDSAL